MKEIVLFYEAVKPIAPSRRSAGKAHGFVSVSPTWKLHSSHLSIGTRRWPDMLPVRWSRSAQGSHSMSSSQSAQILPSAARVGRKKSERRTRKAGLERANNSSARTGRHRRATRFFRQPRAAKICNLSLTSIPWPPALLDIVWVTSRGSVGAPDAKRPA